MKVVAPMRALRHEGFTIVETMVVLAVTGALFVAIAITFSGRQQEAQFTHAINDAQFQIQQVINQVSDGYYANPGFSCSVAGNTVNFSAVVSPQGTNGDCIFLGKVIQFAVQGNNNPEQFRVYTIAGIRGRPLIVGAPFSNVFPTTVGVSGNYLTYSEPGAWQYGLTTSCVRLSGGGCSYGAVGFLMEPNDLSNGGSSVVSGEQLVDLIPISGTSLNATPNATASAINSALQNPSLIVNPANGVEICLVSGTTQESGLITIGGTGRQLTVKLDIKGNTTCS